MSKIRVEVAYALPKKQKIVALYVEEGCTVKEAVLRSKIDAFFPGLDLESIKVGVFGKAVRSAETHVLKDGERVEIYRELKVGPNRTRANRAVKNT